MFVGVTAEKLVGGSFNWGGGDQIYSKLSLRWNIPYLGKFYREKVFVGEKFYYLANILWFFTSEKFPSDKWIYLT